MSAVRRVGGEGRVVAGDRAFLTREAIIAEARALLIDQGLDALSLRGLAARLGVTAPALYAHVDDKADLLRAVAATEFSALVSRLESVAVGTSIEQVRAQSIEFIAFVREHPALYQVMFLFRPSIVPQAGIDELPAASEAVAVAMRPIAAAMDDGYLRRDDPIVVSLSIWAAMQGAASMVMYPFGFDADYEQRIVETLVDAVLAGLAP